ncbi:hypothetical protein GJ496_003167 [Pomphorhynchus laevis]|nr:hypothetical protein GJ496_003167 [Pomphorhynchus laevis]
MFFLDVNYLVNFLSLQCKKRDISAERDDVKRQAMKKEYDEELAEWKVEDAKIKVEEDKAPWNVDTISQEKFSKTIITKAEPQSVEVDDDNDEEAFSRRYTKFVEKHASNVKHFGMLRKVQDTEKFLCDHPELVNEDTANYLVVWCIDLEMEEKYELMGHVARQAITLQFILELAKTLKRDSRGCVRPFFAKMKSNDMDAMSGFTEELEAFKDRIRKRAKEKIDQFIAEEEEKERQQRLGPGGLDPIEVMESLPEELKKCFEVQNVETLKQVLLNMPKQDAEYHLDRCIKSGLWVPGKDSNEDVQTESTEDRNDNAFRKDSDGEAKVEEP